MLFFENQEYCISFYRKCEKFVKNKSYSKELLAEFPSWALLHYSENRSRVDLLFIDFLRHELGRKNSERHLSLTAGTAILKDVTVEASAEAAYFVGQCLEDFSGQEKEILSYYFVEGYSYDEIAKMLHISKSGVKQKIDVSISRLKDKANISS